MRQIGDEIRNFIKIDDHTLAMDNLVVAKMCLEMDFNEVS
jgi:hypothetical protein